MARKAKRICRQCGASFTERHARWCNQITKTNETVYMDVIVEEKK